MTPNLATVHIYGVPLLVQWTGDANVESSDFHVHLGGECIKCLLSSEVKVMIASQLEHRPRDGDRRAH